MSLIDAYRFVYDLYVRFLTTLLLLPFLLYWLRLLLLTPTCPSSTLELELLLLSEEVPALHLYAVSIPAIIPDLFLCLLLLLLLLLMIVVKMDLLLYYGMLKALHDPLEEGINFLVPLGYWLEHHVLAAFEASRGVSH